MVAISCSWLFRRRLFVSVLLAAVLLNVEAVWAVTLTLDSQVDANYGDVEYSAGSTGNIDLGSNGNISYPAGFTGAAVGTAGQFRIRLTGVGSGTAQYTIACNDAASVVSNGAGQTRTLAASYAVSAGTRTTFAAGIQCNGLGSTSGPYTGATRTIYMGTRISVGTALSVGGVYSTGNVGGTDVVFEVIVI